MKELGIRKLGQPYSDYEREILEERIAIMEESNVKWPEILAHETIIWIRIRGKP